MESTRTTFIPFQIMRIGSFHNPERCSIPEAINNTLQHFSNTSETYSLHHLPQILVIQINPEALIHITTSILIEAQPESSSYLLYAVCFYNGSGSTGHYVVETLSAPSNRWFRYQAADINPVTPLSSTDYQPYLLFYRSEKLSWKVQLKDEAHIPPHPAASPSVLPNSPSDSLITSQLFSQTLSTPPHPAASPSVLPNSPSDSLITSQLPSQTLSTPPHPSEPPLPDTPNILSPLHNRVLQEPTVTTKRFPYLGRETRYSCPSCDYTCTRFSLLRTHLSREHNPDRQPKTQYKCSECKKVFRSQKAVRQHYRRQHLNKDKFKCDVDNCNSTFSTSYNYQRHMCRVHGLFNVDNEAESSCPSSKTDFLTPSAFSSSSSSSIKPSQSEDSLKYYFASPFPPPRFLL